MKLIANREYLSQNEHWQQRLHGIIMEQLVTFYDAFSHSPVYNHVEHHALCISVSTNNQIQHKIFACIAYWSENLITQCSSIAAILSLMMMNTLLVFLAMLWAVTYNLVLTFATNPNPIHIPTNHNPTTAWSTTSYSLNRNHHCIWIPCSVYGKQI